MLDWDNLVVGPCVQAFGVPVTYTSPGHQPQAITAVFFRSSMRLMPMGGANGMEPFYLGGTGDVTTREPMLGVQLAQLHGDPLQGDVVYLPTERLAYQVKEVLPDGVGHARLSLTLVID